MVFKRRKKVEPKDKFNPAIVVNPFLKNSQSERNNPQPEYTNPLAIPQVSEEEEEEFEEEEEEEKIEKVAPKRDYKPTAVIIQGALEENGVYKYIVATNYPLGIGSCELTQD